MADTKISGLAALGAAPASGDLFEVVDISDTSMAGTGTNKKIVASDLLAGVYVVGGTDVAVADGGTGASSAATGLSNLGGAPLASPTFTGTPSLPTGTTGVTQSALDNSTKLATTAYHDTAGVSTDISGSITITGFSANPTNVAYRQMRIGKMVIIMVSQLTNGTSNATTKTITGLPVTSATVTNGAWLAPAIFTNGGTNSTTYGRAGIGSNSTTITVGTDAQAAAWTNSGNCKYSFTLMYEGA